MSGTASFGHWYPFAAALATSLAFAPAKSLSREHIVERLQSEIERGNDIRQKKKHVGRTLLFHFPPKGHEHSPRRCPCHQSPRASPLAARRGDSLVTGHLESGGRVRKSDRLSSPSYRQRSDIRSMFSFSKTTQPSFISSTRLASDVSATCAVEVFALALTSSMRRAGVVLHTETSIGGLAIVVTVPMAVFCRC